MYFNARAKAYDPMELEHHFTSFINFFKLFLFSIHSNYDNSTTKSTAQIIKLCLLTRSCLHGSMTTDMVIGNFYVGFNKTDICPQYLIWPSVPNPPGHHIPIIINPTRNLGTAIIYNQHNARADHARLCLFLSNPWGLREIESPTS